LSLETFGALRPADRAALEVEGSRLLAFAAEGSDPVIVVETSTS